MKINSLFRLTCYMLLTIGLCTCVCSVLWYSATSEAFLNEMYIQRKGVNASYEVFRWGMLSGLIFAMMGGTPLLILLLRKWKSVEEITKDQDEQINKAEGNSKIPE